MSEQPKETSKKGSEGQAASTSPASAIGALGVRISVDRPNRELYVSTTRAVAGVSVASFCGLLIGVVALSRHTTNTGPQAARAAETANPIAVVEPVQTPAAPAKPAAVVATKAPAPKPVQLVVVTPGKPAPLITSTPAKRAMPTTSQTPTPIQSAVNPEPGRVIGQTYFIFGSFPKLSDATQAAERLKQHGVTCTVERNLPGWTHKGWYSVVSVKGFASSKEPSCQRELKTLRAKELEPHPYRWRSVQGA